MLDLLCDSDSAAEQNGIDDTLKVNEAFKSRYEYNERRKLLEMGKNKFGAALDVDGKLEVESSSSEDDSDAELLNPRVE